jgi:hypothetical protein
LLDALKRFENLDVRRVGEITFEIARLRGKPLTETQRHGEKFLPTALPSPSSPCFQLSAFSFQHFSIFLRASCMPDSNASLPIRIPAWI